MFGEILPNEAFGFILVTIRLSALVMLVPVFSESSIPTRIRVGFALAVSFIVYSTIKTQLPPIPASVFDLTNLMVHELIIGSMLGLSIRVLMSAIHTAGTVIAFQTGLAAARAFDPSQGQQSVVVAAFLNLVAITLILTTDLHHLMLQGMAFSFEKFPIGEQIPMADFATMVTQHVSGAFFLGFQMASPFIVYGMIFNLGLGLVARMVPGFQVFFVGMPINIFLGFAMMSIVLGSLMTLFLGKFEALLLNMIG
ncbi:MAG: flagellar type III secretion system protein FliR [Kordiimonadaceae bacterium]|nr:flagellar type III secretion system protein FliR [Kordiimonadaceae bacterium]